MKKIAKKISMLAVCVLLCLTTLLGLGLFAPNSIAYAASAPKSVRFKQVEVGEDFAIALSYENELFAWSLTGEERTAFRKPIDSEATTHTLGYYYPTVPTKVDFSFHAEDGKTVVDDSILKIATSQTTAAFITKKGYIYTWGYDKTDMIESGTTFSTMMLLRPSTTQSDYEPGKLYTPNIIYYGSEMLRSVKSDILPNKTSGSNLGGDIIGGDKNYIVTIKTSSTSLEYFSWGSSTFYQHFDKTANGLNNNSLRAGFYLSSLDATRLNSQTAPIMDVGGATAMYISSDGVPYFKGKNFYIPNSSDNIISGSDITMPKLTDAVGTRSAYTNISDTKYKITNGVLDNFTVGTTNSIKLDTSTYTANFIKDANSNSTDRIPVNYKKTDISNGFGYAIGVKDTIAKLYFFGNDTLGQSSVSTEIAAGSAFKEITLPSSFKPVQVAAAKVPTVLNSFDNSNSYSSTSIVSDIPQIGSLSGTTVAFNNTYKDTLLGGKYISAVLGEDGKVYALSNGLTLTEVPFNTMGVNLNLNNRIVSIASGYGNNLFALSNLGKIYKISLTDNYLTESEKFNITLYDRFMYAATEDSDALTDVEKWSVKSNEIRFTKSNERGKPETAEYKQIKAKIKLNGIEFPGLGGDLAKDEQGFSAVSLNGTPLTIPNPTFSFMESNAFNDSTRFLVNSDQKTGNFITGSGINFSDQNLMSRTGAAGDWDKASTLNFYWASDWDYSAGAPNVGVYPIDKKVLNYYFDFSVDYDGGELYYTITPYQSTKERKIVMQFGVGRYDNVANYAVNNGTGKQSQTAFYDFKQTNLTISIGNTGAQYRKDVNYFPASHPLSGNSIIPLLDPNNPFASKYSLAAMDVSTGFSKLAMEITGETSSSATENTQIVDSFIKLAREGDSGFPSSTKIDKGDLNYYNASSANYYNDTYHYLSSDRDGNFIYLSGKDTNYSQANIYDYFNVNIKTVSLVLPVGSMGKEDSFFMELVKPYTGFNNLYGFGLIYDKDKKQLTVSYQVVEIEAIKSNNKVVYNKTSGEDQYSVIDGIKTDANAPGTPMHFLVSQKEMPDAAKFSDLNSEYNKNNSGHSSGNSCDIPVFVQASLSLSGSLIKEMDKSKNDPDKIVPNHLKYGNSTKKINNAEVNALTISDISLSIGVTAKEKYTLNVSQLFYDATNIKFSVNSKSGAEDYASFVKTFGTDKADVTLSATTFTFLPKLADKFTIDLKVHRFDEINSSSIYKLGNQDTEFMTFRLIIVVAPPKISVKSSAPSSYTITGEDNKVIALAERMDYDNDYLVNINNVMSSNEKVLTVTLNQDKKSFGIRGLMSGTAKIYYSASIYGYNVFDSFSVTVQSLVETKEVISLLNVKKIYLSDLKNRLQAVNSDGEFQDFANLELNSTIPEGATLPNPNTAIYYQQKDANGEWVTLADDQKVDFLKSVEVDPDNGEFIRLELSPISATNQVPQTRIVVKFREKNSGKARFEIAFQVQPANKLLTTESGETLVIGINVTADKVNSPDNKSQKAPVVSGTKSSYLVDIPIEYLIGFLPNTNPDNMKIITVTTDEGSGKYFDEEINTTYTSIRLMPKYPTLELDQANKMQKIQVSINDSAKNSTFIVNFYVTIEGFVLTLPKEQYLTILISCAAGVFALLLIIFVIRMGIYWKKKAQQKKIINKNKMLIKMRDKMHNKSEAISREQVVRTKLKMEDPKYAKMFNTMRKDKEEETGITLDSSTVAHKAETKVAASEKASKATKKKKGGKKSLEELKAELEAKKSAFQQMQMGGGMPMEQSIIENAPVFESPDGYSGELTRDDVENQIKAKLASDGDITFDILPNEPNNGNN